MKHKILKLQIAVLFIITPLTVYAQNPGGSESGFSGSLQGGVYVLQTDSQLYTGGSNRRTNDLDGPSDTDGKIGGIASIRLRYQFEGGTAVYAGNPLEAGEELFLAAGVSQPVGNSILDVAVTWAPTGDVWKNPYQTGSGRVKTGAETHGLRFQLLEIAGSPFEAIYNINRTDIEDDEIGDLENDLKRDGYTHELGVKYSLPLKQGLILRPEVSYTYGDIEGASNRYHGIKIGALLKRVRPPWVLIGLVNGFYQSAEQTHPLFDKTRQESGMFTFVQVIRLNLFGVERLFASLGGGYFFSDANIDFFDHQTVVGLATAGINF